MASLVVPYTFANQSGSIPLAELDANFAAIPSNTTPGPIGSVTPDSGSFTTLQATGLIAFAAMPVTRATVDQSITNSTTLTNATNMAFAIAANEEWVADFDLDIGSALATTGFKVAITVPTGASLNAMESCSTVVFAGSTIGFTGRATTSGTDFGIPSASLANTANGYLRVSVWVLNGATPGTVQLQFAQATSSATALTLRKGSHMRANRIA